MADGTKAVVDTSVADEAALAVALGELPSEAPAKPAGPEEPDQPAEPEPLAEPVAESADEPVAEPLAESEPDQDSKTAGESEKAEQPVTEPVTESLKAEKSTESGESTEATAPLSKAELAAELGAGGAKPASGSGAKSAAKSTGTASAKALAESTGTVTSTETLDADTGTLPAALPAPAHHSGDKIVGRYRLEECITQSESFSSWRAVDEKLRRAVGVHLLSAGHRRAKAVLTAARSAALLNDVRFVQVLDAVQVGDLVYVIREWLPDASDLATLLARGPMEPYDAYQMVRQVSETMAAAHRRGQAHLRLTPRCVLRTEAGQYRINGIAVDAALHDVPDEDSELVDAQAIGALLYAALTHRWPYPEDRYDLQGLPKSLGCVPPDQVKAGVHKGLSEIAARVLCEHPPHHQERITTPEQLAKATALMPKVRPPEQPAPPAFAPPRYPAPKAARPVHSQATTEALQRPTPPAPPRRGRGLRRLAKWTASVVALAAIGTGSWQLVDHLHHTAHKVSGTVAGSQSPSAPSTAAAPTGARLTIANVAAFNAFGDNKAEHTPELAYLTDGNPATAWTTQHYDDQFGNGYRNGTGVLVDLGSAKAVSSVDVQFLGVHKVELRATPADLSTVPNPDESGFGSFHGSVAAGSGTSVRLTPDKPVTTRYLLIWLTGIPNDVGGGYRGKVAEINVYG